MSTIEENLMYLLNNLGGGFCLRLDEKIRISQSKRLSAREFAIEVLRSEGFKTPEYEKKWIKFFEKKFKDHFGRAEIAVDDYEASAPDNSHQS